MAFPPRSLSSLAVKSRDSQFHLPNSVSFAVHLWSPDGRWRKCPLREARRRRSPLHVVQARSCLFSIRATLYIQLAVIFEWDEAKNRTNAVKQGIRFETAKLAFADPYLVSFPERNVAGEERWQSLGSADGMVILTITHTVRDKDGNEVIRIISARKASPSERRRYAN